MYDDAYRVRTGRALPVDLRPAERLGGGALGETWRAVRRGEPELPGKSPLVDHLPRVVAVKLVPGAGAPRALAVGRSLVHRERDLAGRISRLLFVGVVSGDLVLGSDFVEGESLGGFRHRQGLTTADALSLLQEVAEALGELASVGLFHGDLKPTSIVRGERGWWLTDAAVAALLHRLAGNPDGPFSGTPPYGAPELARGGPLGVTADVYSLGVLVGAAWGSAGRGDGGPSPGHEGRRSRPGRLSGPRAVRWWAKPVDRAHDGEGLPSARTGQIVGGPGGCPPSHDAAGRLDARRFRRRTSRVSPDGLEASVSDLLRRMTATDSRRRPSPEEIRREATDLLARLGADDGGANPGPATVRTGDRGSAGARGDSPGLARPGTRPGTRPATRAGTRSEGGGSTVTSPGATDHVGPEEVAGTAECGPVADATRGERGPTVGLPVVGGSEPAARRWQADSPRVELRREPPEVDPAPGRGAPESVSGSEGSPVPGPDVTGPEIQPEPPRTGGGSSRTPFGRPVRPGAPPVRPATPSATPASDGQLAESVVRAPRATPGVRIERRPEESLGLPLGAPAGGATSAERRRRRILTALGAAAAVFLVGWLALGHPTLPFLSGSAPRSLSGPADGRLVQIRRPEPPGGPSRVGAGAADVGVLGAEGSPSVPPKPLCPGPEPGIVPRATVLYADVSGEGCLSRVVWAKGVVQVALRPGGRLRRFRLGRAGDVLLLGRFTCAPRATLGLYRPRSGQLFVFASWPRPGETVTPVDAWATGRRDGRVVVTAEGRCQTVEVEPNRKH